MAEKLAMKYGGGGSSSLMDNLDIHANMYTGEGYGFPKQQAFELCTLDIDSHVTVTINLTASSVNTQQKIIIRLNNVDILSTEYNSSAQTVQTTTTEPGTLGIYIYNNNLGSGRTIFETTIVKA